MYYLAKIAQATGLTVIGAGFFVAFPKLLNAKIFASGVLIFIFGWIIEAFLLKGKK